MDGERMQSSQVRKLNYCPGCGKPPAPIHPRLLCDPCRDDSQRRADETMALIESMRAARERKTDD